LDCLDPWHRQEGDKEVSMGSLTSSIADLTEVFTMIIAMIGDLLELFMQPPLIIFVALAFVGIIIGYVRKLIRS